MWGAGCKHGGRDRGHFPPPLAVATWLLAVVAYREALDAAKGPASKRSTRDSAQANCCTAPLPSCAGCVASLAGRAWAATAGTATAFGAEVASDMRWLLSLLLGMHKPLGCQTPLPKLCQHPSPAGTWERVLHLYPGWRGGRGGSRGLLKSLSAHHEGGLSGAAARGSLAPLSL